MWLWSKGGPISAAVGAGFRAGFLGGGGVPAEPWRASRAGPGKGGHGLGWVDEFSSPKEVHVQRPVRRKWDPIIQAEGWNPIRRGLCRGFFSFFRRRL